MILPAMLLGWAAVAQSPGDAEIPTVAYPHIAQQAATLHAFVPKQWKLEARANVPRLENQNQDEPFEEVKIVARTLQLKMHVFMSAGGWEMGGTAYTFRWQDGGFRLIGFDRDTVRRNTGETRDISINYLNGRKVTKSGYIAGDRGNTRVTTLPKKPLLALSDIGDGLMFDPDEH